MNAARMYSVRELIVELAGIEDAIRKTPPFILDGTALSTANPELARLLHAERRVIGRLHRIPTKAFGQPLAALGPHL